MKIKCPACAKVLNVPDAARGKAVKCPCGKHIKIPAGSAPQSAPAAPAPAANEDLFNELTESDLRSARPREVATEEDADEDAKPAKQSGSPLKLILALLLVVLVIGGVGASVYFFVLQ